MSKLLNWYYVNTIRNFISQSSDALYEITNQPNVYQTYSDAIILSGKEVNRFVQILKSIVIGTRFYCNIGGVVTISVSCSSPRTFSCWVIDDGISESFYSLSTQTAYQSTQFSLNVQPNHTYTVFIVSESESNPQDVFVYATSSTKLYPYPSPFVYIADSDILGTTLCNLFNVQLERYQPLIVGAGTTVTTSNLTPNRILISDTNGKIATTIISSLELGQLSNIQGNVQAQLDGKQSTITGAASSIVSTNLPTDRILISDGSGKVAASAITTNELSTLSGVTGNVQGQFNALGTNITNLTNTKQDVITGAATTITNNNLTAGRVLISNPAGKVAIGNATATELSYLSGVTSGVQGQLTFLNTTKQNLITGAATTVTLSNLSTNKVVISNAQGKIAASTIPVSDLLSLLNTASVIGTLSNLSPERVVVTDPQGKLSTSDIYITNLETLAGVTENIQTQLDFKQNTITGAASTITEFNLDPNLVVITDPDGKLTTSMISLSNLNLLEGLTSNVQAQLDTKQFNITGAASSVTLSNLDPDLVVVTDPEGKLTTSAISLSNLNLLEGLTSNVQAQLDTKQFNITGAASSVTLSNLDPNLVVITDPEGKLTTSAISLSNLNLLEGLTSNIQAQLDTKQFNITGAASSVTLSNLDPDLVVVTDPEGKLTTSAISLSNLNLLEGLTSNVQAQLDTKQFNITGAASSVTLSNLDPDLVVVTDANGKLTTSSTPLSYLNYINSLTGNVQDQLDGKLSLTGGVVTGEVYIASTLTTCNLSVIGQSAMIDTINILSSNMIIENITGFGPALRVTQKSLDGSGHIAEFYDYDISTINPIFSIADLGNVGIGTYDPTANFHVEGTVRFASLDPSRVLITDPNSYIQTSPVTTTELSYVSGVTSSIQTQIDNIQDSFTGAVTTIISSNLSQARILISDANGKVGVGTVTSTELTYLAGSRENIQTQLDNIAGTFTGAVTTIISSNLTPNLILVSDANGKVGVGTVTRTELTYLSGVTSGIQTQIDSKQATITGGATTITTANLTPNLILVSDANGKVGVGTVTSTELTYLSGVTSSIQTQINSKQATITGGATTITTANLTPNLILVSDANGKVGVGTVTSTELTYLSGVTSGIQTQINNKQNTITGGATTITTANLTPNLILVSDANGKVGVGTVTSTELTYLSGVTSSIQTQINSKQATITGGATTITTANLTFNRALTSDANGKVAVSAVTSTELGYLSGVTSAIQTQINNKQDTITGGATTITTNNLTINRALISDANGKVAVSAVTSNELGYLSGTTSNVQSQINNIQNIANIAYLSSGGSNIAGNVTLSNVVIRGSLLTNGGVGILGPTVLLQSANATTASGAQISMTSIGTFSGGVCTFASVDANGLAVTFNTDGVYRISCLKAVGDKSSAAQRTWTIRKLSSANATLDETTPQFTSIAGAEIGLRVGEKIAIINTGQSQSWYNVTPSLWSVIPLTIGYNG